MVYRKPEMVKNVQELQRKNIKGLQQAQSQESEPDHIKNQTFELEQETRDNIEPSLQKVENSREQNQTDDIRCEEPVRESDSSKPMEKMYGSAFEPNDEGVILAPAKYGRRRQKGKKLTRNMVAQNSTAKAMQGSFHDGHRVLKSCNREIYYVTELKYLLDWDPTVSFGDDLPLERISSIVEECPTVCGKTYDLYTLGQRREILPLFALLSFKAPLELIEKVFKLHPICFSREVDNLGNSAMHYTLEFHPPTLDILRFLISKDKECGHVCNSRGQLPLHTACASSSSDFNVIQLVLENSPKQASLTPDVSGNLPLHLALKYSNTSFDVVKLLLDAAPSSISVATHGNDLPVDLVNKLGIKNEIRDLIVAMTPEGRCPSKTDGELVVGAPVRQGNAGAANEIDRAANREEQQLVENESQKPDATTVRDLLFSPDLMLSVSSLSFGWSYSVCSDSDFF